MKLNTTISSIPPDGRAKNERTGANKQLVSEFIASGRSFAKVDLEFHETLDHKRSALATLVRTRRLPVMVMTRRGGLYLIRSDTQEATP